MIKRIGSNFIDIILLIVFFYVITFVSGLNRNSGENLVFIFFISFFLSTILPILINGNTFGKIILKLKWRDRINLRILLVLKYLLYALYFTPGFSFFNLLTSLVNKLEFLRGFELNIFFSLLILDILVFILSLGRFHILDYFLNLQLKNLPYKRTAFKSLNLILSSLFIAICTQIYALGKGMTLNNYALSLFDNFYEENFPADKFYGNKPIVLKEKSNRVLTTSEIYSFLLNIEYDLKTIILVIPEEIFLSDSDKKKICIELINQSITNDTFAFYKPRQTKIILKAYKIGDFFETYNYTSTYYFNNDSGDWGIYGGIKDDSTFVKNYLNFLKNLKYEPIKNSNKIKYTFTGNISDDKFLIKNSDNILKFEKLSFENAHMSKTMEINYPHSIFDVGKKVDIISNSYKDDEDNWYLFYSRDSISDPLIK